VFQAVAFGFRTKGSCEGHLEGYHHYPWITIKIEHQFGKDALRAMTDRFNDTSDTKWLLVEEAGVKDLVLLRPDTKASIFSIREEEFGTLQASAGDFAVFLYNRYLADTEVRKKLSRMCRQFKLAEIRGGFADVSPRAASA